MKKKHLLVLCAVILCFSLLLNGCASLFVLRDLGAAITDLSKEISDSTSSGMDYTSYEDFPRPYEPFLDPVSFSEISYSRPDVDALCDSFHEVQAMVEEEASVDDILDAYYPVNEDYFYFYTLSSYAYVCYCLDLSSEYYESEYKWCENQSPLIEQAAEECYTAMAKSSRRDDLETEYFGEGFFEYYDVNQVYTNDRVVELMQEESALQSEYMALQNEMTILWDGQERLVDELFNDPDLSYDEYLKVYEIYYEKYSPLATDIFVKLVKVRRELAEELGYESYAQFAYAYEYERDYTPEQVASYTDSIATYLSDYYYTALSCTYSTFMASHTVMDKLDSIAHNMGKEISIAYDFMSDFELYDISASPNKMPGSYVSYLDSYEMPFMYISPTGDISDLLTAAHEFGHFVDSYVNCNETTSIDCAEVFSQGLEFLAIEHSDLSNSQKKFLTASKFSDSLLTFLYQGCYAEFEQKVYELSEEELTAENINTLFLECNDKFGITTSGMEHIIAPGWIDIQHFFIAPFYVISYCVSNDAALQLYEIQLENGVGLDTYCDLLYIAPGNTLLSMLEEAKMQSPFAEGRMQELATLFKNSLKF